MFKHLQDKAPGQFQFRDADSSELSESDTKPHCEIFCCVMFYRSPSWLWGERGFGRIKNDERPGIKEEDPTSVRTASVWPGHVWLITLRCSLCTAERWNIINVTSCFHWLFMCRHQEIIQKQFQVLMSCFVGATEMRRFVTAVSVWGRWVHRPVSLWVTDEISLIQQEV